MLKMKPAWFDDDDKDDRLAEVGAMLEKPFVVRKITDSHDDLSEYVAKTQSKVCQFI